ncbi:MAG TPA: hypothetical protein VG758_01610 [Hyphomicrobiaceae bacterium]|jgi:hypothetical protein|nr:hypothetical protein [Hyphomicrobiaceae bacterium]
MRRLHTLVLAGLALVASMDVVAARIHGEMYCWALDSELPIGCEEEDEEAGLRGGRRAQK